MVVIKRAPLTASGFDPGTFVRPRHDAMPSGATGDHVMAVGESIRNLGVLLGTQRVGASPDALKVGSSVVSMFGHRVVVQTTTMIVIQW